VGDPNQAIFETFTTASPELLRAFIQNNPSIDMPESGRSQPSIISLANHLIDWVMTSHPIPEARTALSAPHIVPVPEDDPQQNPPDDPEAIKFISKKYTPEEELEAVVKSVKGYVDSIWDFPDEDKPTIAILVPRNQRGVDVVNALRQKGIEPIELISSTSETRAAAGSLSYLLAYLADPSSAKKLSKAYAIKRLARQTQESARGADAYAGALGSQGLESEYTLVERHVAGVDFDQDVGAAVLDHAERHQCLEHPQPHLLGIDPILDRKADKLRHLCATIAQAPDFAGIDFID